MNYGVGNTKYVHDVEQVISPYHRRHFSQFFTLLPSGYTCFSPQSHIPWPRSLILIGRLVELSELLLNIKSNHKFIHFIYLRRTFTPSFEEKLYPSGVAVKCDPHVFYNHRGFQCNRGGRGKAGGKRMQGDNDLMLIYTCFKHFSFAHPSN